MQVCMVDGWSHSILVLVSVETSKSSEMLASLKTEPRRDGGCLEATASRIEEDNRLAGALTHFSLRLFALEKRLDHSR